MTSSQAPFQREEKQTLVAIVASVAAILGLNVYVLTFAGSAFVDFAQASGSKTQTQAVLALLGASGVVACALASRWYAPARGQWHLAMGFASCLVGAALTLLAKHPVVAFISAVIVGAGTAWTAVSLALCLRPTLHSSRLGVWCGLGTGLAYVICSQPLLFEARLEGKTITAVIVAGLGLVMALRMRGTPTKPSSMPDYALPAATAWIVALVVLVFLDTLVFFIIKNSLALRQLAWETPLILQGNAFVHLSAAFVAGMALDQRWTGSAALVALLLLTSSCVVLGMSIEHFPKARILYVAGVSIYSTVLLFLPARGGRPKFAALLYALCGCLGSGLALYSAVTFGLRKVPPSFIIIGIVLGAAALFARLLWLKRAQEIDAERLITRSAIP